MSRRGSKGGKRSPTKSRQRLQGAVSKPAAEKFDRFLFEAESPEMTNTSLDMRGQYFAHWLLGRDQILTKLKEDFGECVSGPPWLLSSDTSSLDSGTVAVVAFESIAGSLFSGTVAWPAWFNRADLIASVMIIRLLHSKLATVAIVSSELMSAAQSSSFLTVPG